MANYIAIKLERMKIAEMSCIAGVGRGVRSLVKVAKSGSSQAVWGKLLIAVWTGHGRAKDCALADRLRQSFSDGAAAI